MRVFRTRDGSADGVGAGETPRRGMGGFPRPSRRMGAGVGVLSGAAALPKHWAAETKGFYVFRCGTGPDAFVTQVFLKSQVAQQKFTYRDNKGVKTVDLEAVLVRGQGSFLVVSAP